MEHWKSPAKAQSTTLRLQARLPIQKDACKIYAQINCYFPKLSHSKQSLNADEANLHRA
jgi:hypothetical protein